VSRARWSGPNNSLLLHFAESYGWDGQTNQLAIRAHLTQPPHSVLCDARSHVHRFEAGGIAYHSQATTLSVTASNGHHMTLEDVLSSVILGDDIHMAPTKVAALCVPRLGCYSDDFRRHCA
jgi:threonine aldolase